MLSRMKSSAQTPSYMEETYLSLNDWLRQQFDGRRIQKLTVDAGLSCPNRDGSISTGGCIFCNDTGSGSGAFSKGVSIIDQILPAKKHLTRRYKAHEFLIYFQSYSNTHAPVEHLRKIYEEALAVPDVVGLSIGTRPDCVDEEKIALLAELAQHHMIWVEYGLQSANDETLQRICRGHDTKTFQQAVALTQHRGIYICAHVILGLPGETYEDMMRTARFIAHNGIHGIKLHFLYVIRNTPLASLHEQNQYTCLTLDEYAELACDFLELQPPDMVIQRLSSLPHEEELIAPLWALDKNAPAKAIQAIFKKRGTRQGSRFKKEMSTP